MTLPAADALGQVIVALPACLLLAVVGLALSLRKDRLYALLTLAAAMWFVQTGIGALVASGTTWSQTSGNALPVSVQEWMAPASFGVQTALKTASWIAIGVAMLWPRSPEDANRGDALPEDAVG